MQTKIVVLLGAAVLVSGCGKKGSTTSAFSADKPSVMMGQLALAVGTVGSGLKTSTLLAANASEAAQLSPMFTSSQCSEHGEPLGLTGNTDTSYAGLLTYCKLSTDTKDPESIQGVFTGVQGISCMIENAGPVYDGVAHDLKLTFSTACFTALSLSHMDIADGTQITASVTASSPAAFNTYYDRGVAVTISLGSETKIYNFAGKASGNVLEVAFEEDPGTTKSGSGAGYLNLDTGVVRVESRMQRLKAEPSDANDTSVGFNRHVRLYATLAMDGTTPKDPKDVEFVYSNIQDCPPTAGCGHGGMNAPGGLLVTASGDLSTTGIKALSFYPQATTSLTDLQTISNWTAVTNSFCYTSTTDTATTCGAGLPKMSTNTKFIMAQQDFVSPGDWFASTKGMTFTSVSADSDTP